MSALIVFQAGEVLARRGGGPRSNSALWYGIEVIGDSLLRIPQAA
jgi:hypothetical protein